MKIHTSITIVLLSLLVFTTKAQELDKATVQSLIDSGSFVFRAQTMIPAGGNSRHLTASYDVRVTKDSLTTYLPYAGRAYTGVLPGEAGINFNSSEFDYKASFKKKKWSISIKPKDSNPVKELNFIVFENGSSTLVVYPLNKQPITYYGYLKKN